MWGLIISDPDHCLSFCFSYRWQSRQDGSARAELHILQRIGRAEVCNVFHVTSLVVRPVEVRVQNFRSLAVLSNWKCGRRTLHL